MATSGTTSFSLDVLEIVEEAFENVGLEVRTGYDLKTARRSLDLMMREWQNRGINFWTVDQETASVTASTATLTLDASTIDILDAAWRDSSSQDRTMTRMSMPEYTHISNKTQTGMPSRFWVNRTSTPVVYFWPVPVSDGTFFYYRLRQIQDAGSYTNNMDIPVRFLPALTTGLAYYLSMKTPAAMQRVPMLQAEYQRQFDLAAGEDRERASIRLVPDIG
jgi:hypothetical protein